MSDTPSVQPRNNPFSPAIEWGIHAALFLVPVVVLFPSPTPNSGLIKNLLFGLITMGLVALWGLESLWAGRLIWRRTALDLPAAGYLGWTFLSLIWSEQRWATWTEVGRLANGVVFYFLVTAHLREPQQLRRAVGAALAAVVVACAAGVPEYLGYHPRYWGGDPTRLSSTLANATFFGAHLALLWPIALAAFLAATRRQERVALGGLLLLMYFCLLATYTRAAWLGLALALVLCGALWAHYRRQAPSLPPGVRPGLVAAALGLIAVTGLVAATGPLSLTGRLASSFTSDLSNIQRVMTWQAAVTLFRAHPLLGTGAGTFGLRSAEALDPNFANIGESTLVDHAHNEFLEIASDTGAVGVILFLGVLAAAAGSGLRALRGGASGPGWYLALGLTGGLVAFLIQNLAGVSLRMAPGTQYLWWGFALLAVLADPGPGPDPSAQRPVPRRLLLTTAAGLAVWFATSCWFVLKPYRAEIWMTRGLNASTEHRDGEALAAFEQGLRINPYALRGYGAMAAIYLRNGQLQQALEEYQKLARLAPPHPDLDYGLGQALLGLRRTQDAVEVLERAASREYSPRVLIVLAYAYAAEGDRARALHAADEAGRLADQGLPYERVSPTEVHLRRAELNGKLGRRPEAVADALKAASLSPQLPEPHLLLGDLYRQWGQPTQALEAYRRATTVASRDAGGYLGLAQVYASLGQWEQAAESLGTAAFLRPHDPQIGLELGLANLKLGRTAAARRYLEAVAQLGPGDRLGAAALAALQKLPKAP